MSDPLVSAVIPTYGRPERVTRAIESVANQTYDRVELVVVDDCSPSPIEPHVEALELTAFERVVVERHEENRGAVGARRTGIDVSTGDYVAFLDDDDRWEAGKVSAQVDALENGGPATGVSYCGMRVVDENGETVRRHVPDASGDLTRTLLCRNVVGSYSTVMVTRRAIDDTGPPDDRFPTWQDLEWYVRLSRNWEFVAVDEPLTVIYQAETHDQMSDDFETIRDRTYPLFVDTFRPLAAEYGPLFERKMRAWAAFRVGGYNALRTGNFADARRYLLRAVIRYPFELKFWPYLLVSLGGESTYRTTTRLKRYLLD